MKQINLKLMDAEKNCDIYNVNSEVREFILKNYIHCSIYTEQHKDKIKNCSQCSKVFKISDPICLLRHQKNTKYLCRTCYDKKFVSISNSDEEEEELDDWY